MSAPPDRVRPSCERTTLDVLEGTRAMAYAGHHLRIEGVAPDAMSVAMAAATVALGAALTILL